MRGEERWCEERQRVTEGQQVATTASYNSNE
jgi:hypothetical protein